MDRDTPDDPFEDLFEPFELDEGPPPGVEPPPVVQRREITQPVTRRRTAAISCPSCAASNPPSNRHCEACGARIQASPLPVAPPPALKMTPGGRTLGVLLGVLVVVFIFSRFIGGDGADPATTSTAAPTSTTLNVPLSLITPTTADANSVLTASLGADNLIDDDRLKEWQSNGDRGVDVELTFTWATPVAISEIRIQNVVDDTRFKRNYRIQEFTITVDDITLETSGRLDNTNDQQRIAIATLKTTRLTLRVISTYPGEIVAGNNPFNELVVAEIEFFGREVTPTQ